MDFRKDFAVATDIVVFSIENQELMVLLVKRGIAPFKGQWALPGGFVRADEGLEDCARRELHEETGLADLYLEQLYSFGDVGRDVRGRVISVAYLALMRAGSRKLTAGSDAAEGRWVALSQLPALAFDHDRILDLARNRLISKIKYSTLALQLMPDEFTLAELQQVHEVLSGRAIDKRNFRKHITAQNLVVETGEMRAAGAHRPAALYRAAHGRDVVYFD
jgi:8-oxo-dGTP diphosphatase